MPQDYMVSNVEYTIFLLSYVKRRPLGKFLEPWMVHFIVTKYSRKQKIDWTIIHDQLIMVKDDLKFFMASYIVYMLVSKSNQPILSKRMFEDGVPM